MKTLCFHEKQISGCLLKSENIVQPVLTENGHHPTENAKRHNLDYEQQRSLTSLDCFETEVNKCGINDNETVE